MPTPKVMIVDDHILVRNGLREMLGAYTDLQVAGDYADGHQALTALKQGATCDVLLLDLTLGEQSGLDVLHTVRLEHPGVVVLVLSAHSEAQFGLNVLRAGAHGYISKGASEADLLRAIRQIARGAKYVSAELSTLLVNGKTNGSEGPLHTSLSTREFQIFGKLAEGVSVTEISTLLNLSVKTVSTYRTRILEKMNMETNADIVRYALSNELRSA